MKIKLGDKVTDKITGFSGIIVARTEYLYGCESFAVASQELKDLKPVEWQWFDESRLAEYTVKEPGGVQENCAPER